MSTPAAAISQQVIWKNPEMRRFAVELVRAALKKLDRGASQFTTDIVADELRGDGTGIAGTVITMLKNSTVIEPVGVMSGKLFYAHRVKSERKDAKDRWLNVYRLVSRGMGESFLRHNSAGLTPVATQPELSQMDNFQPAPREGTRPTGFLPRTDLCPPQVVLKEAPTQIL